MTLQALFQYVFGFPNEKAIEKSLLLLLFACLF